MSVFVEELDAEHKLIIAEIGELYSSRRGNPHNTLQERLSFLIDHLVSHFAHEESYMEKEQYTKLGAHKEIHHVFVNDMTALLQRLNNAERFEISDESLNTIARWLDNHILTEDKDYAIYAARRALAPAEDRGARPA